MDAIGNKLSPCKIPDQYLKRQKCYLTFRTLATLTDEKKENSVVFTSLKKINTHLKSRVYQ